MTLLQIHLLSVSFWLGLIAAEVVLERCGRGPDARRTVAAVHGWIDVLFEIPIMVVVLITGALLLQRAWPPTPLLLVKVGAAMIVFVANLICVPLVRARWKATDDERMRVLTRQVTKTGWGIPFAVLALVLGLYLPASA